MISNEKYSKKRATRRQGLAGRQRTPVSRTPSATCSRGDTYHTMVWAANLFLVTIFPLLLVFGTVVPLLSETVPFLASRCPVPIDVTPVLQLLVVGFLAALAIQFYGLQLPLCRRSLRHEEDKWCRRCSRFVARDATHCRVCNQCIEGRIFHCFFLSVCIGRTNISACRSLLLRMAAGSLAVLVLLLLEAALSHAPSTGLMMFFLCAASFSEHLLGAMDRSPVKRGSFTSISSDHQHKQ